MKTNDRQILTLGAMTIKAICAFFLVVLNGTAFTVAHLAPERSGIEFIGAMLFIMSSLGIIAMIVATVVSVAEAIDKIGPVNSYVTLSDSTLFWHSVFRKLGGSKNVN